MTNIEIDRTTERPTLIDGIELGLNIIAQDILWKHKEREIDNFIKRFHFEEIKK